MGWIDALRKTGRAASAALSRSLPSPKAQPTQPQGQELPPQELRDTWIAFATAGNEQLARELLSGHPALLDSRCDASANGATALGLAATTDNLNAIRLLLDFGADPLAPNTNGSDALMLAAAYRNWDALAALLLACKEAKRINDQGQTALMLAAKHNPPATETHPALRALAAISDAAALDRNGCTALIWAVRHSNRPMVEVLLPLSPMDAKDNEQGLKAWEWAWENQDFSLLDLMAAHPSSESWRGEVFQKLREGALDARKLPQTLLVALACDEARVLRDAIGSATANAPAAEPSNAAISASIASATEGAGAENSLRDGEAASVSPPTGSRASARLVRRI